jgi:hypothetical protein
MKEGVIKMLREIINGGMTRDTPLSQPEYSPDDVYDDSSPKTINISEDHQVVIPDLIV